MPSDWMEHAPDPTLGLQFAWEGDPWAKCLSCNTRIPHYTARFCHDGIGGGCGIRFEFVATAVIGEWEQKTYDLRPDLIPRKVQWG